MMPFNKTLFTLFAFGLIPIFNYGQQFKYTAPLAQVGSSGFYTIAISPELSAYIKTDYSDIRITNQQKQWVPHILQTEKATLVENLFVPFPILQNMISDSGRNILVVENTKPGGIFNLKLFLKNSAVSRIAILSGSNNQRDWYIIDENIAIGRSYETVKDEYVQEINFPLIKYHYLKLSIDNAHNDPLLITRTGFYASANTIKPNNYQANPGTLVTQKDSGSYSYVEVKQQKKYHFDKISFIVNGSKFYSRDIQICLPQYTKNNFTIPGKVIADFKLLSALPLTFGLPKTSAEVFFIVIKNGDNPPLTIDRVETMQQTCNLVTYLEKGKKYDLVFGDSLASFADYDLQNFKDSVANMRPLNFGDIQLVNQKAIKTPVSSDRWIWPTIIIACIALSFLCYRLVGDINKQKNN